MFDPPDTPPPTAKERFLAVLREGREMAASNPFAAIAIGAFLLLGVVAVVATVTRPTAPPVVVPALGTLPPAAAPAATPAATAPAAAAPAAAAPVAPAAAAPAAVLMPPRVAAAAAVERGGVLAVATSAGHGQPFVEVGEIALEGGEAVAAFDWHQVAKRASAFWPGEFSGVQIEKRGLVEVRQAGPVTAVLIARELGRCSADVAGQRVIQRIDADHPQAVAAAPVALAAGWHPVVLRCELALRPFTDLRGGAALALRQGEPQPVVIELHREAAATAAPSAPEAVPAPTPNPNPAAIAPEAVP